MYHFCLQEWHFKRLQLLLLPHLLVRSMAFSVLAFGSLGSVKISKVLILSDSNDIDVKCPVLFHLFVVESMYASETEVHIVVHIIC